MAEQRGAAAHEQHPGPADRSGSASTDPANPSVSPAASDDATFSEIYPGLRRFAAVVGVGATDPDDLVQEALARTLARQPLSELDDAGRYLRLSIVRLAANERRRRGRAGRAWARLAAEPSHSPFPDPGTIVGAQEGIGSALRKLSVRDRAIVYLSVIEAWDSDPVAEHLGLRAPAVRKAKERALRTLAVSNEEGD